MEKISISDIHPKVLPKVTQEELLSINRRLHQLYGRFFDGNKETTADGMSREDLINATVFVWREMLSRGLTVSEDTSLYKEVIRLVGSLEKISSGEVYFVAMEKEERKPIICIHHRDFDGITAAAIDYRNFPGKVELFGIDYGEELPDEVLAGRSSVHMLDYCLQPFERMIKLSEYLAKNNIEFIWIDHHQEAIKEAVKYNFEPHGVRSIGKAACELTWEYFYPDKKLPEVVTFAGRFDVWDHSDPDTVLVHYAMEANEEANDPASEWWDTWLKRKRNQFGSLITKGEAIKEWLTVFNAQLMDSSAFDLNWEGLRCIAACSVMPGSGQFESVKGGYDAAVSFHYRPKGRWHVGMYALKNDIDVGPICSKYGGGGHKGAGGFQCKKLPFTLPQEKREALVKWARKTADINPGSTGSLTPITPDDVVPYFKTIILRKPAVSLVGSICNQEASLNDIDVLVHGPMDDAMRQVVEFRLGRALPPKLSQRMQFHDESLGGPFTDHIHLYDLALVPRTDRREVVRMSDRVKKQDPSLDWPKQPGPHDAVVQLHSRGKGVHTDLRFKMNGYLTGWTLFSMVPKSTEDINTVAELKAVYVGFSSSNGNKYLKPLLAPAKLAATPKLRQNADWLGVSGRVFGEGEVGSTAREEGVMVAVARPRVEWGLQLPHFHEYFLTGDKVWQGPLYFRLLVSEGGTDKQTPEGEVFWTTFLSKNALPSVLKTRSVEAGHMPKDGFSGIPRSLEEVTPPEFRYWKENGAKAREIRDELVKSRFFTESNVAMVDGQFRRVVRKTYLYVPPTETTEKSHGPWNQLGGSSRYAEKLISMFPTHKTYVEPFMGAASVLFTKERSEREVLADLNAEAVHAMKYIRDWSPAKEKALAAFDWTASKKTYDRAKACKPGSSHERLWKFIYGRRWGFGGVVSYCPVREGKTFDYTKLARFSERLKGVEIIHSDAIDTLAKYDGKDTFFYVDPPYPDEWDKRGGEGTPKIDLGPLFESLKKLKGKYLLELGDTESQKTLIKSLGLPIHRFDVSESASRFHGGGRKVGQRHVVRNYETAKKADKRRFTLSWLYWRGPMQVRSGPSREVWILFIEEGDGLVAWLLQHNPIGSSEPITGIEQYFKGKGLLAADQKLEPGEAIDGNVLNDTKDTPAWVRPLASGKAEVIEEKPGFRRIKFDSEKLNGEWTITAEEEGSMIWTMETSNRTSKADGDDPLTPSRKNLSPGQRFQPMKPRGGAGIGEFKEIDQVLENWLTLEKLKIGVYVEPKWNGMRVVASRDEFASEGKKVSIWFEDSRDERAGILPGVTAELEKITGSWIIDGELLDTNDGQFLPRSSLGRFTGNVKPQSDSGVVIKVFRVLFWDEKGGNITDEDETEQDKTVSEFLRGGFHHLQNTPKTLVKTETELRREVEKVKKEPGSEGAMIKLPDATYSLGGGTSSWVKLKTVRRINALVYKKDPVEGSTDTWNYYCAVGPINASDGFIEKETVEFSGKLWAVIGRTANTNVKADMGQIIQVTVYELQVDKKEGSRRIHWFGPPVVELLRDDLHNPMTVKEVESLATEMEVRKLLNKIENIIIPLCKTDRSNDDEQYVLGIVLEPNDGESGPLNPDTQKDIYSKEEIRQACFLYMKQFQSVGFMHRIAVDKKVDVVECYISPVTFDILDAYGEKQRVVEGTWLLGLHILDKSLWEKVKSNELNALSIDGSARRLPANVMSL